ncbi:hypothetical protein QFZ41_002244 [Luteibacter sp. W1I16]|uniref:hypothetical protein n=1 Tax=Luteibacter sp. W1I16 TaxID=3373922 RepID=UPI003D239B9B
MNKSYRIPALSMAKRCDLSKLTVEQRLVDDVRGMSAYKVCVERKFSTMEMLPDYAIIRKLRFGTGYQLAIAFGPRSSEKVSKTIRNSVYNDVVVYRNDKVIDTFYPLDDGFQGEIYFWFRDREDLDVTMDLVMGLSPVHGG